LSISDIFLSFDTLDAAVLLHHQKQIKNTMKKIAFGLQVFTLLIVLPLYVFMEMNHAKQQSTENSISNNPTEKVKANVVVIRSTQESKIKS
jgi:hypothetical protein